MRHVFSQRISTPSSAEQAATLFFVNSHRPPASRRMKDLHTDTAEQIATSAAFRQEASLALRTPRIVFCADSHVSDIISMVIVLAPSA